MRGACWRDGTAPTLEVAAKQTCRADHETREEEEALSIDVRD